MSHELLFPNKYKGLGWVLLIPSLIFGMYLILTDYEASGLQVKMFSLFPTEFFGEKKYFSFISVNITNTLTGVAFLIGCLLVGFSKEKYEDEFIAKIRLSSLLWAVLLNYILLLLAFIFVYGTSFLSVMIYNMYTVLLIFIIRFHYLLYKNSKLATDEK